MKIVIAPDSYKESLSADEVALAIEAGFREIFPEADYQKYPMADGGEGTVALLLQALGGHWHRVTVSGPLGTPLEAGYGLTDDGLALVEMAAASGLALLAPAQRNPLLTSSRGTGELIQAALDAGAQRFLICIGGSASNDGGAGMLQALGVRLLDENGLELAPGGGALAQLQQIDASGLDPRIQDCIFDIACDVDNPLTGPQGASMVFGPQKGATPLMVRQLETSLQQFALVVEQCTGHALAHTPGAGAAGGMAAALLAFMQGRLQSGSELVAAAIGLEDALRKADLVITGEGRLDGQSIQGKAPMGVVRLAQRYGCPVIAIAGSLSPDCPLLYPLGLNAAVAAVSRICSLSEAIQDARNNVQHAARNAAALVQLGMHLGGQDRSGHL
jgi:glycerate kinase